MRARNGRGWRATPPNEKRKLMLRFAQLIRENGERLKRVVNAENGGIYHRQLRVPLLVLDCR